ncbi:MULTISPECIES: hypothetical protein [unclassified Cupriavidus]|nr:MULTISPECIES: hypothetical protein [unclassified Cupriavidus]MCA3184498.1 hypothetical protein [Cupriavidus sp.]MCA3188825.1 hypothetical protein [Cupriavidus sp.]MCA3198545.1 hypothetical protein [Cupriavidus sp.]MCA3201291.1 hypothetical protein [Cupriavidus sp.]MCA3206340.1 hypothetical protein [Cupriavidus sp.]
MRVMFSTIGMFFLLASVQGCTTVSDTGERQSSVTAYGTVDAGVSVTRDR